MSLRPKRLVVRSYQVGFGDCYLLTFDYGAKQKYVLIDFGSKALPESLKKGGGLKKIAADIRAECKGKLDAIVATHRHSDHISGFATTKKGDGPGDIIRSCNPGLVIQPWTEEPKARANAKGPVSKLTAKGLAVRTLDSVQAASAGLITELESLKGSITPPIYELAKGVADNNLSNPLAVANLAAMGKKGKSAHVYFGAKTKLERVLPGVTVRVLGPPTIKQSEKVQRQARRNEKEYWHLQARTAESVVHSPRGGLFPRYVRRGNPIDARWQRRRLAQLRASMTYELVRSMDKALNNTSVILLFKIGTKAYLFPGDAQFENWAFALSKPDVQADLKRTVLYKVGHHGSLNATPKTMWEYFKPTRGKKGKRGRLQTIVSTLAGPHNRPGTETEVPRRKLVAALKKDSDYFSTQSLGRKLKKDFAFQIR